jgi:hypothetical protein
VPKASFSLPILALCLALLFAPTVRAAVEVDLDGRIVSIVGTALKLDADGATLTLDISEVDSRFLEVLRPGDDVRVKAFRLADGSLLVYAIFLQVESGPPQHKPDDSSSD